MKRRQWLSWGIVGLTALCLRFWNYGNRWVLNQDQARDAVIGWYGWEKGIWPQIGSPSSAGPFNFGPWYHWIIMCFEKITPGVMGPWVAFTLLTVISVFLYAAIGKRYYGNKGIIIFGLMAAVAVGQVENAPDMLNTVIMGFFSAVAMWAIMKLVEEEKWGWSVLTGVMVGLAINSHFQAWGLMGLLLAIFLVNKFSLINRIRWGVALGLGWLISFLPLLIFDIKHNWMWLKSVVEYYTVGVKKFYVPVRWLTEIRDFWPQLFGSVTVGINWFGYIWLVLGIIIVAVIIKKRKKIDRFWWILALSLLIQVGLMRMYKGVRSREYLIAFHGYIILFCSWVMAEFYQWKKYLGIIISGAVLILAGWMDVKIIKERESQAKEILKINEEIKGKVEIYNYKESNMVAMPIFYLRYREGQIGEEEKIGFCDSSRYQCPAGAEKIFGRYQMYKLTEKTEGFEKITGENTFNSLMVNYGEKNGDTKGEVLEVEKYATIVNPVRSRGLWKDKSLKPIEKQYEIINNNEVKATWLLQDDVLDDEELIDKIKSFNEKQELGIFLEISKNLALKSRVYFDEQRAWYDPGIIFLSAYEREDRIKLIDKMMENFKKRFGYWPKSVGAWWVDSYSLNYLEKKYGIKSAMIVTDQKTTDNYGVWGQWWGYPYFPSKNNILAPGEASVLIIQWALRDPEKAFLGSGPKVSNYSMQANDYISQGLDIKYFKKLAEIYFDPRNKLGQITVGLETGIESVGFIEEYRRQIEWIKNEEIKSATMSEMADRYKEIYWGNPTEIWIGEWKLTPQYRENKKLGERIEYKNNLVFVDYYKKDENNFLNRIYEEKNLIKKALLPKEIWLVLIAIMTGILLGILWPKKKWLLMLAVLWILINLLEKLRYSIVDGEKMFGILIDNFRFLGITDKWRIVNNDLPNLVAKSMLKLNIRGIYLIGWVLLGALTTKIYGKFIERRKNQKSN